MRPGKLWASTVSTHQTLAWTPGRNTDRREDRAGLIAAEDGPRSGLTSGHVQRADKYGGGYFVNVEGMHHLHCLVTRLSPPRSSEGHTR